MNKTEKLPPLEAGILAAMRALDNQVAREMQRSPAEREAHGVLKWQPINNRVELVSTLLLENLSQQKTELDSLLIMAQALSKTLSLYVQELETAGLGKARTDYCLKALEQISRDATQGINSIKTGGEIN